MKQLYYFILIIFLTTSCSNNKNDLSQTQEEKQEQEKQQQSEETSFVYTYDRASTEVKWTAFKHMAKVPVGGKFGQVEIYDFQPSNKISDAIKNVSFSIFTSSTNTQDKDRDMKIVANFFGNMLNPTLIYGKIKDIEGSENGNGNVLIRMNGVEKLIPFDWKVNENNQFILTTKLNVLDWNLDQALEILNTVCLEKHTGKDKVNKLWPDVEVIVFTTLKKEQSS
jgi:hypothetical protein